MTSAKPRENTFRTQLKLDGDISLMQTEEQITTFRTSLLGLFGDSTPFNLTILDIYAGSINVVYDVEASSQTDLDAL